MSSSDKPAMNPYAAAAGKMPPGLSPKERYSSYNGIPMTAVLGVICSFAVIFYCVRIYVKCRVLKKIGWDDLVCTLGLIGVLLNLVCIAIDSISGPLGKHLWNVTLAQYLGNVHVIPSYIRQVTTTPTLGLIKLAIFLCYYDIFWPLDWCRWTIIVCASLSSAFYLAMSIVQFYLMTPRPGETFGKHFSGKMAARVPHLSIPTTSIGLVIDVLLFLIPLRAIFQMSMPKNQKIRASIAFLIGFMAIIGSILTLVFKEKTYGKIDQTYHLILVNFFLSIEMSLGICIASMPFLYRALKRHRAKSSPPRNNVILSSRPKNNFISSFIHGRVDISGHIGQDSESGTVEILGEQESEGGYQQSDPKPDSRDGLGRELER